MQLMFLTVLSLFVTCSLAAFGDKCEVVTWSNLGGIDDQVINVTFPKDCLSGDVDWNYPKGSLLLTHSEEGKNFQLCIETGWGTDVSKIQEIVDGHYSLLALPTQDNPTCIKSTNGVTNVLVSSPDGQRYMTMFNYRIIPEK